MNKTKVIKWCEKAGVRAIKTMAQSFIASVGTTATFGGVDWKIVISTMLMAALLSLVTSLSGLPELKEE